MATLQGFAGNSALPRNSNWLRLALSPGFYNCGGGGAGGGFTGNQFLVPLVGELGNGNDVAQDKGRAGEEFFLP